MTNENWDAMRPIFVAATVGCIHNISTELRLDGANGYNKYLYIKKGSGKAMIDGVTTGFGPNTLIYIPDHCPHRVDLGVNTQSYAIAIPVEKPIALPKEPVILPITSTADISLLVQLFDTCMHEFRTENFGSLAAVESYIALIKIQLDRIERGPDLAQKPTAAESLMRRYAYLVEQKFSSGQNLEAYARELNVTPTHLSRVCRQLNGKSASEFLQDRVMAEARRMLLISESKIQEIAKNLGFTSAAYFSRFFAARLDMSPKEFRKARTNFHALPAH